MFCVPGLNCYSCPGAVGACPIGAIQSSLALRPTSVPYYVLGCLLLLGTIFGRAICGFLCPFGLIQELLYKIPVPKQKRRTLAVDRWLRKCKFFVLAGMVVILPLTLAYTPAFCKWLCPVGTLEGAIPLLVLHAGNLDFPKGVLYWWKLGVLAVVLGVSTRIYRPFCRYVCPLGAIYGCANPISIYRGQVDKTQCVECGKCSAVCPMQIDPLKNPNSTECIRCGACASACPSHAIRFDFRFPRFAESEKVSEQKKKT